jgi:hypothetical protein
MELGNESNYQQHKGPIRVTPSSKRSKGAFKALWAVWEVALSTLKQYEEKKGQENRRKRKKKRQNDPERIKLLYDVKTTRAAMDAYNRYSINVRGASSTAYGSFKEANIVTQFATLIKVTMPSPTAQEAVLQHMRPLEHLGEGSAYTAWMTDYGEEKGATDSSDGNGDNYIGEDSDDNGVDLDDNGDDSDDNDDPMDEAMLEGGNEMDYN